MKARHSSDLEPPLPIYMGLNIHHMAGSKKLIEQLITCEKFTNWNYYSCISIWTIKRSCGPGLSCKVNSWCSLLPESDIFNWGLFSPGFALGNWKMLIPVSWNDFTAIVELGLWSKLSRAPTVNNLSVQLQPLSKDRKNDSCSIG